MTPLTGEMKNSVTPTINLTTALDSPNAGNQLSTALISIKKVITSIQTLRVVNITYITLFNILSPIFSALKSRGATPYGIARGILYRN